MSIIQIIVIGKLKENYWKEAANEYIKRMNRYCSLQILEIRETFLPDHPGDSQIEKALHQEEIEITKHLLPLSSTYVLDIHGKELHSEAFSDLLYKEMAVKGRNLSFVIGSSYGLSKAIKKQYPSLSFSKLTFPHQLFRIILLEQIYRSLKIQAGEIYHK